LWASTSTKDKSYSDVKYIEALVGANTISTMPPATLAAYRKKGEPRRRIAEDLDAALSLQERLAALGVDPDDAAETLEREGVRKFIEPYDASLQALAQQIPRG
jgi:transaldolase